MFIYVYLIFLLLLLTVCFIIYNVRVIIMLTCLGEELLQLFVKNERGGKVLICDEGK